MKRWTLALCLTAFAAGAKPTAPSPPPKQTQARLPPAIDAAGLRTLLQHSVGHPVVINVFASWCEPCRAELPDLAKLKKKHPRAVLIGIDVDKSDDALRELLPAIPAELTVVRSRSGFAPLESAVHFPSDWNEAMPPGWEENVPLTFVLDERGRFATGSVGQLTPQAIEAFERVLR